MMTATALIFAQAVYPSLTATEKLVVAQSVAACELAPWRKIHPKADLSISFNDPSITTVQTTALRSRLGYKNPIAKLDPQVLTVVVDDASRTAPKRFTMDAYVFLGSFPKGFRARYVVGIEGKAPKVLSRTILQRYELPTDA